MILEMTDLAKHLLDISTVTRVGIITISMRIITITHIMRITMPLKSLNGKIIGTGRMKLKNLSPAVRSLKTSRI